MHLGYGDRLHDGFGANIQRSSDYTGFLKSFGLGRPTGRARKQWPPCTRSMIGTVSNAPALSFSRGMVGALAEVRKWQSACFASGGLRGFACQSVAIRTVRSSSHGRMVMRSYANDATKTLKVSYHGALEICMFLRMVASERV